MVVEHELDPTDPPAVADDPPPSRRYTSKQMGDACEMLVAAELTLAGIPALKVPDNWPDYDVIAQPIAQAPVRISVKSRTFKRGSAYVEYRETDRFEWLAIVLLPRVPTDQRLSYLIPRERADQLARRDKATSKTAGLRYYRIDEVQRLFGFYRDNFALQDCTNPAEPDVAAHHDVAA